MFLKYMIELFIELVQPTKGMFIFKTTKRSQLENNAKDEKIITMSNAHLYHDHDRGHDRDGLLVPYEYIDRGL